MITMLSYLNNLFWGGKMNKYEELMVKAEACLSVAKAYQVLGEKDMVKFWNNAYHGFVIKAHKLNTKINEL